MATKNTFGILFYIRRARVTNGKTIIYARITVDKVRLDFSTKQLIEPENWDNVRGIVKGKSEEMKMLNLYLEQYKSRLIECYQELHVSKKLITAEAIKNKFFGEEEERHTLMKVFDYHNEEMKTFLEWGTLKNYFTSRKYFQLYLQKSLKTSDIFLTELNYRFLIGFEKFMKENNSLDYSKPCGQNTIMKHIERLRKVVNLAIKNEWLEKDPFMKFKPVFHKTEREFLSETELAEIESKDFEMTRLQHVKDMFVFSCYTGLAYIDLMKLTPNDIVKGIDGKLWISTRRKKTDVSVRIPLLNKPMELIEKYKNHPVACHYGVLFPPISNQRMNLYLKELADVCKITKPLTFHIARHTFATTITLTNGVPIETVSKLLGHTSIRTTQIYAKVIEQKVGTDIDKLREKLEKGNVTLKRNVG